MTQANPGTGPGELFTDASTSTTSTSPTSPTTTTSTNKPDTSKNVNLYLPYFYNVFKYGPGEGDAITGINGKDLSRSDADKVLKLASDNDIVVLERDVTNA